MKLEKKVEKIVQIFSRFWEDRHITDMSLQEIDRLERMVRDFLKAAEQKTDRDLVLWLKVQQLIWREKSAALRVRGKRSSGDFTDGMIVGFRKAWQQLLFPYLNLRDETLDPELLRKAEKEWTEKAKNHIRQHRLTAE